MVLMVDDQRDPILVSMSDAVATILTLTKSHAASTRTVIGIAGPVGAGKSTLAHALGTPDGVVISTDSYLPDYAQLPEGERDDPKHADLGLLAQHLALLRSGLAVEIPVWCFQEHRRTGTRRVDAASLILCEGIHAFDVRVFSSLDIAVYVDAPAEHRWLRWETLERAGERGWGVEVARRYFSQVAEPTFERVAAMWRTKADVVVSNPNAGSASTLSG